MHEMMIATELLRQLKALADEHGLARITHVAVAAGEMRGVVPEALDMAFSEASRGTVADGATLELTIVPTKARCRQCGQAFQPTVDSFLCPACEHADVEFIEGNDIVLSSIDGESS
jgi:hydrogenase nickel incorporation protein HypA/HybF